MEQKKSQGLEWELQMKQTRHLLGQPNLHRAGSRWGGDKCIKEGSQDWLGPLLWDPPTLCLLNKTLSCNWTVTLSTVSNLCCGETEPRKLHTLLTGRSLGNGHEMPPKHGQICGCEGACWLETGTCRLPLLRLNLASCRAAELQYSLKGIQGRCQKSGTHTVLWKNGQNRPSDSQMFSGKDFFFYEPKFLHLLIPREILTS